MDIRRFGFSVSLAFSLKSLILENLKFLSLGPARFQVTARAVTQSQSPRMHASPFGNAAFTSPENLHLSPKMHPETFLPSLIDSLVLIQHCRHALDCWTCLFLALQFCIHSLLNDCFPNILSILAFSDT